MNLLLDTHVLLWWFGADPTLSGKAAKAIGEGENLVFVSAVTAWEIAIKKALGKLEAPDNLAEEMSEHRFTELSITIAHTLALADLPGHHQDPFDRMLVAQAKVEKLTLITRDKQLRKYNVPIIEA